MSSLVWGKFQSVYILALLQVRTCTIPQVVIETHLTDISTQAAHGLICGFQDY